MFDQVTMRVWKVVWSVELQYAAWCLLQPFLPQFFVTSHKCLLDCLVMLLATLLALCELWLRDLELLLVPFLVTLLLMCLSLGIIDDLVAQRGKVIFVFAIVKKHPFGVVIWPLLPEEKFESRHFRRSFQALTNRCRPFWWLVRLEARSWSHVWLLTQFWWVDAERTTLTLR